MELLIKNHTINTQTLFTLLKQRLLNEYCFFSNVFKSIDQERTENLKTFKKTYAGGSRWK